MKDKSKKDDITSLPRSEYQEAMRSLKEALTRCLQMLKISQYKDMNESSIHYIENVSQEHIKAFGNWIICLNAIADSCLANKHTLSQSETYDFLTVAVATNIEEKIRNANAGTSSMVAKTVTPPISTSATAASIASIEKKKEELYVDEADKERIIESLNSITSRNKKELELSLSKLQRIDIIRLGHLCENYSKLQRYCEIIHGSEEKFRVELQKDIGRKLSHHQLQRAATSIKQAKMYIENVLDGKFQPHGSYGINHVKHNLEYGYQLTGLIQSRRRSSYKR